MILSYQRVRKDTHLVVACRVLCGAGLCCQACWKRTMFAMPCMFPQTQSRQLERQAWVALRRSARL